MESRKRVAQDWSRGNSHTGANVSTNGREVYSYNHIVGVTLDDGTKVAYDCHYSVTTAKHCSAFKAVADTVTPCDSCYPGLSSAPIKVVKTGRKAKEYGRIAL